MENGFIVISRKMRDWKYHDYPEALSLWIHLLLMANWKEGYFYGQKIEKGELVTSVSSLMKATGIKSNNTVRKWLKIFEKDGMISSKSTNKYTLIKVINYTFFQDLKNEGAQQGAQQGAHNRTRKPENQKTNIGGGMEEAWKKLDFYHERAKTIYRNQESQVDEAYTKLEEIMANLPSGDNRKVTPNIPEACLYAEQFWIDHDYGNVGNPEGYIRKILSKNHRNEHHENQNQN